MADPLFYCAVSAPVPLHTRPLCAAATPSPLKEAAVLLDQRHVVTRDRGGAVLVWDVTTGAVVQRRVAASSLAEAVAALFRPEAVPPWFTVSVESGACRKSLAAPVRHSLSRGAHETVPLFCKGRKGRKLLSFTDTYKDASRLCFWVSSLILIVSLCL